MSRKMIRLPAWLPVTLGVTLTAALLGVASGLLPQPRWPDLATRDNQIADDRLADQAESTMRQASQLIREAKRQAGITLDGLGADDPSGLVGAEMTALVTTLGSLESKQLSTSTAWARVLVAQLKGVGVGKGSIVAGSFSGSFPALNLAVACACRSLGARLVVVSSVTSSTWGANQPGFTWPEIEARLADAGLIAIASVAVSTGGEDDRAADLEPDARLLADQIGDRAAARLRAVRLRPSNSAQAVASRIELFDRVAGGRPIAVYVNVGGSQASMGRSTAVLKLKSGWLGRDSFRNGPDDGVMAQMATRGVRVLHLLNIRDLAVRWGIL
jgi:poly-gamma-glutamate system protein